MKLSKLILCIAGSIIAVGMRAEDAAERSDKIFDLDEFEVLGETLEKPDLDFRSESPRISYYTPPELPNGELIVALDFMDRYVTSQVPGPTKWAATVTFPWISGRGLRHVQWLCLYLWNGTVYGFCPTAKFDWNRRFALPVSVDRKTDPEELYSMASKYVEEISPPDVKLPLNPEADYIEIPAGEIEGWRPSDRGKRREELVSILFEYLKDPNPDPVAPGDMGPDDQFIEDNRFWNKYFSFDFSPDPDPFYVARDLLKPRWSIRATLLYQRDILFFKDVNHKAEVLLFSVGQPVFAYHPRYGVWKTDATVAMIAQGRGSDRITYPGVRKSMRVILKSWPDH